MNKNQLTIKDSSVAFVCSFVVCQIFATIFSFAISALLATLNLIEIESFSKSCTYTLIASSLMYLSMFFIFKFSTKNKENKITNKTTFKKALIYSLIAIVTFFCLYPIVNSLDYLLENIGFKLSKPTYEFNLQNYLTLLLPLAILPPICEELLFRGLIFKGLEKHGKAFSILTTSAMFAIYHMSLQQTLYPILFGALLTFVMLKENNIYYCILMHFINNFLALTLMFLKVKLFTPKAWYFILALILAAIFIITLIYFVKKQKITSNKAKIEKNYLFLLITVFAIMFILWLISNIYR